MVRMKRKWWLAVAAVLIAAVCGFCFREALMVRLFPKAVLSGAISDAFSELENRYADSPMHLLAAALDPDGCQNVKMKLDTSTQFLGAAHYDLELQTQRSPNRVVGEGSVSTGNGILDLKLYLDENFAALSSDSLTEGAYYGITYDTFPADIRGFQLLGFLAGEDTLVQWDASVARLAEVMRTNLTLPEISEADIRMALLGALVLKPQVTAGEGRHEYDITFTAQGRELAQKAEPYLDQAPESLAQLVSVLEADPDSSFKLVFHLNSRKLTALDASLTLSGASYDTRISITENQLRGELICREGEDLDRRELTVQTVSDGDTYREKVVSSRTRNGVQRQLSADYSWDLSSGDMVLDITKDGKKHPIRLNLKGEGAFLTITCQEFEKVMCLLTGKEKDRPAICVMTISPGGPVAEAGEYKNISQWSMEDLFLLIKRIGGLIGIQIP